MAIYNTQARRRRHSRKARDFRGERNVICAVLFARRLGVDRASLLLPYCTTSAAVCVCDSHMRTVSPLKQVSAMLVDLHCDVLALLTHNSSPPMVTGSHYSEGPQWGSKLLRHLQQQQSSKQM